MEKAFEIILAALYEELQKQGFGEAKEYTDEKGRAYMFAAEDVVYGVCYDSKKQLFILQSNTIDADGKFGHDWKQLSQWLFDKNEGTQADATSIANDFVEVVMGPRRIAAVQTARKRTKKKGEDENNIDPMFFYNRLVGIFPELKDEMNQEKITYGKIRFAFLAKNKIAPRVEALAQTNPDSDTFKKLRTLICEMYKDGDSDLRSLITAGILNNIDDNEVIHLMSEEFGDDLKKVYKCSRKLKGKVIKPEKPKKQKKVVAAALDNANR